MLYFEFLDGLESFVKNGDSWDGHSYGELTKDFYLYMGTNEENHEFDEHHVVFEVFRQESQEEALERIALMRANPLWWVPISNTAFRAYMRLFLETKKDSWGEEVDISFFDYLSLNGVNDPEMGGDEAVNVVSNIFQNSNSYDEASEKLTSYCREVSV